MADVALKGVEDAATVDSAQAASPIQALWRRQLDSYPDTRPRMTYLAIVVLATIILYYQFYIPGAVASSIIAARSARSRRVWPTAGDGPTSSRTGWSSPGC
jgi:hypothetical protein